MNQALLTDRSASWRAKAVDHLSLERNVGIASAAVFLLGFGEELWKKFVPKYLLRNGTLVKKFGNGEKK